MEEIEGKGDGQQGNDGNSQTHEMRALGFGLVFLNLELLLLSMISGCIVVGLATVQTVADYFREVSVASLVVVSFRVLFLFTGCDGTGTENDGIVLIERVASHAALQFVVGCQRLIVHAQRHLRGGNHAASGKGLPIAAVVKKREILACFLCGSQFFTYHFSLFT